MFITDVNDSGMFDVKVYEILVINLKCILDKYDFLNNKKKKNPKTRAKLLKSDHQLNQPKF